MRKRQPLAWYVDGIRAGQVPVLSQAITLAESAQAADADLVQALLDALPPQPHETLRLGVTGSPGVGKSTLVEALGLYWAQQGHRVAVLAVDPSSERSGGSILGDKTRMAQLAAHPQAYIRPSPAGDQLGGVTRATRESILLCEAAGYSRIVVETVGVGQSETEVRNLVDAFLLLLQPGAGDDLQGIKRGIMELADILAVTRADTEPTAARRTAQDYQAALHLAAPHPTGWQVPVVTVGSPTMLGLVELDRTLQDFLHLLTASGEYARQRQRQQERWFVQAAQQAVWEAFLQQATQRAAFEELRQAVASGQLRPSQALLRLLPRA